MKNGSLFQSLRIEIRVQEFDPVQRSVKLVHGYVVVQVTICCTSCHDSCHKCSRGGSKSMVSQEPRRLDFQWKTGLF